MNTTIEVARNYLQTEVDQKWHDLSLVPEKLGGLIANLRSLDSKSISIGTRHSGPFIELAS